MAKRRPVFKLEEVEVDDNNVETNSNSGNYRDHNNRNYRDQNNDRYQNSNRFSNNRNPNHNKPSPAESERKLKEALNLQNPELWYPKAREMKRKFVYHCGPTNSGKTYSATEAFMKAKRGIYCCPLRLQASEIQERCSANGIACDLLTGEEHWYVQESGKAADHLACTIYMASNEQEYDVAVVDEIQNIADRENGYAWTRAILGLQAKEIHVCGEETGIELVNNLVEQLDEEIEIEEHERDNQLIIERKPLKNLRYAQDGDCIVCFRKKHVRKVVRELNKVGKKSAKIYGTMPPAVKKDQAKIFNDPNNPTTILVATDAIGQGLNLAIRRVVFYELRKTTPDENGVKSLQYLNSTHAKHIAGRAGRKNLNCGEGKVTALQDDDLRVVTELLSEEPVDLRQAGLQPPVEKLVDFAIAFRNLHPEFSSYNMEAVLDKFKQTASLNTDMYFLCALDNVRRGSEQLKDVRLKIEDKFKFCTAPIPSSSSFLYEILKNMAEKYRDRKLIEVSWLSEMLDWKNLPWNPESVDDLEKLESASHALNLYMWLGNKFDDYFPDVSQIDEMQERLLNVIKQTIENMADLRDDSDDTRQNTGNHRPQFSRPPYQQNRPRQPPYQNNRWYSGGDNQQPNYHQNSHNNAYANRNARIGPRRNFQQYD